MRSLPVRLSVNNSSGVEQSDSGNVDKPEVGKIRIDGDVQKACELDGHEDFSLFILIEVVEMGTASSGGPHGLFKLRRHLWVPLLGTQIRVFVQSRKDSHHISQWKLEETRKTEKYNRKLDGDGRRDRR